MNSDTGTFDPIDPALMKALGEAHADGAVATAFVPADSPFQRIALSEVVTLKGELCIVESFGPGPGQVVLRLLNKEERLSLGNRHERRARSRELERA